MKGEQGIKSHIKYQYLSGVYKDGQPYNGAFAQMNLLEANWKFKTVSTKGDPKTAVQFVEEFNKEKNERAEIVWNGGYILNPELVGKLGLPESFIGSPLGLLISDGKVLCPPLFNKAALLIDIHGKIEISRVNCSRGIQLSKDNWNIKLTERNYNQTSRGGVITYYDLLSDVNEIDGDGRVIVRLSGNVIKEIKRTEKGEGVKIIPVGLTLSFTSDDFPNHLAVGDELEMHVPGMDHVLHAIEAGPLLLRDGKEQIDMAAEGWKTNHSIHTQAARLDYMDMRGPKIAAGIDDNGKLIVLTINGRIRESVGATHTDMADILKDLGLKVAMGFDPGGSSTLVVGDKVLNISPYNSSYEENVYALPPEPRAISNAIIGYIE